MSQMQPMRIGLDFDNTIVCYDQAIARLADELFELPAELPRTKLGLRDFLRASAREAEWTAFQGELYGPGMSHAEPFDGAIATMQQLEEEGHELAIISHRSRRPYAGPPHDLHAAALLWVADRLQSVGLFTNNSSAVSFLETREAKLAHIRQVGCKIFLDDLPDILSSPLFPSNVVAIHFAPATLGGEQYFKQSISSWSELPGVLARL